MAYWFEDPVLKAFMPLGTAHAVRAMRTFFRTPFFISGFNVFPEGPVMGRSTADIIASRAPKKRAFIVADPFSERFAAKVAGYFQANGFTTQIWPKALPEVPIDNVMECGDAMAAFEPDVIFAVGGGSVIDGAKASWIHYERPDITDFGMQVTPLQALGLRQKAILVAVPTTSGTGSECTAVSVLHDTATHRKVPIGNGDLMPDIAILYPEFTMSMPPKLTAGTGLDVLAHAVDAVMTPAASDWTDAISLAAVKSVFKYLPRAYQNGKDREARYRMMIAASGAGIGFGQSGAALTHSFGHTLGSLFNVHHGVAVGVFIPYCLQYYQTVTDKHLDICYALRIPAGSPEEGLAKLNQAIRDLFRSLDAPLTLKDIGIAEADLNRQMDALVKFSLEDIDTAASPRNMTPAQCEKIIRYAYDGKDIDF